MENDRQPRLSLVGSAHQGAAFGILERSKALPTLHKSPPYFWPSPNSGCAPFILKRVNFHPTPAVCRLPFALLPVPRSLFPIPLLDNWIQHLLSGQL